MSDATSTGDRYRQLTGDYYWDSEAISAMQYILMAVSFIVVPPLGGALIGWWGVGALTAADNREQEEDQ